MNSTGMGCDVSDSPLITHSLTRNNKYLTTKFKIFHSKMEKIDKAWYKTCLQWLPDSGQVKYERLKNDIKARTGHKQATGSLLLLYLPPLGAVWYYVNGFGQF
jgi:hypothetical protein